MIGRAVRLRYMARIAVAERPRPGLAALAPCIAPRLCGVAHAALWGALVLGLGGCSINLPMTSLVPEPETTASLAPATSPSALGILDEEWQQASEALDRALDPAQNGSPVRWSVKETGRGGVFVASGPAYVRNDQVCRAFKASIGAVPQDRHHLGTACRSGAGLWALDKVKPVPG